MSMQIINRIMMDFALFSSVDSIVTLSYVLIDRNINVSIVKYISLIVGLAFINSVLCAFIPKFIFQVLLVVYSALIITYVTKSKIKPNVISIFKIMIIMLIIQTIYAVILKVTINIELATFEVNFKLFIYLIPSALAELIFIYFKYKKSKSLKEVR